MNFYLTCENCSVRVDTDEEMDGRYDREQDVYMCPLCTAEGDAQYLVEKVRPKVMT